MTDLPNDSVRFTQADGIATLTLDRPAALNALNNDMVAALCAATLRAEQDPDIRVVILQGGDNFMAGGDLKWFKERLDGEPDKTVLRHEFERFVHEVHPIILRLRRMPKPVLASVQGAVAGFGISLMLACDLAIAAETAVFTLAYSLIGASPDGGSSYALPRTVGLKRAFEIALLGDRFDAETACATGLVNRVVPSDALATETAALARRLAAGPTHAYANTKALLNASLHRNLEDQLDAEARSFADCAGTDDFAEGIAAFIDKRKPRFTGR